LVCFLGGAGAQKTNQRYFSDRYYVEVEHLREEALRAFGQVDVWIINAGRAITRQVLDMTDEDFDQMMVINTKSALYGTPLPPGGFRSGATAQTPGQTSAAIVELIDHPRAEIYTNPGQSEMVARYYTDVAAFEENMGR
jgi:NAD(P)-dependent dehydrogenase (short-subunit alcohol dehydrogenase family)